MIDFKRYFILVVAFVLFGCTEDRAEQAPPPPELDGSSGTEEGVGSSDVSSGYDYTISIASEGESVYAYYSKNNVFPIKEERFFQLKEGECVRIRGDQFANLSIYASRGSATIFRSGDGSLPAKTLIVDSSYYMPLL